MAHYLSEITEFLQQYKQAHPETEQEQRAGRALLWDKTPLPLSERRRLDASRVKQPAYVYQPKGQ